jgi:hypothetical protein
MRLKIYDALCRVLLLILVIQTPTFANNPNSDFKGNQPLPFSLLTRDTLSNPSPCQLGIPIIDDDCTGDQEFAIEVINPPGDTLGMDVYLKEVRLIIAHEWDLDLDIFLISPSGKVVTLSTDNGDTGDNYGDPLDVTCGSFTTFLAHTSPDACAALDVENGVAPFIGNYLPEGSFSEFNDGITDPEGMWILKICDDAEANEGTLEFVELVFEPLSCIPPSQIQVLAIDSTSVLLDWVPGNFCSNSIVEYGTNLGFMPGTGIAVGGGDAAPAAICPPVLIDNLDPNTTYELYVREFCGNNEYSSNSCPISFSTSCSPRPSTLVENFDSQDACEPTCGFQCPLTGTWRNSLIDGFDWTVHQGETTSSLTGPSDDVQGGGKYIYLEASGPECQNEFAYLVSNCIQVNSSLDTCDMSFYYHMYGFHTGKLALEITTDGGVTWEELWSVDGDQGDVWLFKYIDLSAYDGQIVQFRFSGKTGNNFRSDMALDQITLYGSQDLGPGSLTYYVDKDGDGFGDSNMFFRTCWQLSIPGFSELGGDCDDEAAFINPGMEESPCDGLDLNCNGDDDELFLSKPFVNTGADTIEVCSNEPAILEAFPQFFGDIYWYEEPVGGNVLHLGQTFEINNLPINSTPNPIYFSFYAEEVNDSGCVSEERAKVTVAIFPNPDISTNDDILICAGEVFDLADLNIIDATQSSAGFQYYRGQISQNLLLNSSLISPSFSTTYTIVASTSIGCKDTLEVLINVKQSPQPFIFGDGTLCRPSSTNLSAVNIGGGVAPFTFEWNTGSTNSTTTAYSGTVIGQEDFYVVSITDSEGCLGVDSFQVTTIGSIEAISTNSNDVTTCDGSDGAINLAILGGEPPFNFDWKGPNNSSGSGTNNSTSFSISNLTQGSYSITITDDSDEICPFVINNVLVNGPSVIIREPDVTEPKCFGSNDGTIFLDIIGSDYTLFWNTGDTTELISNLSAGLYEATVVAGDCVTEIPINLSQPPQLTVSANIENITCPGGNDGKINLSVFGGTPVYSYNWSNGQFLDSLTNLSEGIYTVSVSDVQGCETVLPIEVTAPDPILIDTIHYKPVSCHTGRDGTIKVEVTGGTPIYSYLWDNDNTTTQVSFLAAGNYSLTVTDENGCTASESFLLIQPDPIEIEFVEIDDATCVGIDDGAVEISVTGGNPDYQFNWSNGTQNQNPTNLAPGEYWVQLVDSKFCKATSDTIEILSPAELSFEKISTDPFCRGINNGKIEIDTNTIMGGNAPFDFEWIGGVSGAIISDLSEGEYIVTITDDAGCVFFDTSFLNAGEPIDIQVDMISPACFQTNTGSINVTTFGGISPYSILWNNGADDFSISMLSDGAYWATVTDNVGCFLVSDTIQLTDPLPLSLTTESLEDNVCFGGLEGSIDVTLNGGTLPYAFSWSSGSTNEDISNLGQGNYTLTVTDANACPLIKTFSISEPPPLNLNTSIVNIPKCDLDPIDSVCIIPSGGLDPYHYLWSTGDTTSCLVQVATGEYSVTVTDGKGCSEVMESVKYPDPIEPLSVELIEQESQLTQCFDAKDGVLTINFIGGTGPYEYNWNHGLTGNTDSDTLKVTQLESGICNVTVVDANECMAVSSSWQVGQAQLLTALIEEVSHVKCFDGSDGSIELNIAGGTSPYEYGWLDENGDTLTQNQNIDSLAVGAYSFYVTDSINCSFEIEEVKINQPEQALTILDFPPQIQDVTCFGNSDGSIKLIPNGGVPPYAYDWSNGGVTDSLANLGVGNYGITITDANDCLLSSELTIEGPDTTIYLVDEVINPISCFGEEDGSVLLMVEGGWGNYSFRWNDPMLTNTLDLVGVGGGTYSLEIKDEGDCIFNKQFTIDEPDEITLDITTSDQNGTSLGTANVVANGGVEPYQYAWSSGQDTSYVDDLLEGMYIVTVTDANGCKIQRQVKINFVNNVDNYTFSEVKLFPNPTDGTINLVFDSQKKLDLEIQITDLFGREIEYLRRENIKEGQLNFDLGNEPSGIYLMRITDGGKLVYSTKIIRM